MTTEVEDWNIQINLKHGPQDDKGVPIHMTNVRGKNAADLLAHAEELAEFAGQITGALDRFLAGGNVVNAFPEAEVVLEGEVVPPAPPATNNAQYTNNQVISACPVNPTARHRYKEGVSKGKAWRAIMCSNKPECQPQWLRD